LAELSLQDRLQPSLLDRLTDQDPDRLEEGVDKKFATLEQLRDAVKRDLTWLLNSCNLGSTQDLSNYPEVARSTINYGMPDLAGATRSGIDAHSLERTIRQAILDFEPRILRHGLKVHTVDLQDHDVERSLTIQIEGVLWAQPAPIDIVLQSEVNLEDGSVAVRE
jgi:type VI secretion system protein ImpF